MTGTDALAKFHETWDNLIPGHVHALEFFGGVPRLIVPDNPKAGVLQPHRYEPRLHPAYQEWAAHYGCAIVPARVRKPRDYAEVGVIPKNVHPPRGCAMLRHRPSDDEIHLRDNT